MVSQQVCIALCWLQGVQKLLKDRLKVKIAEPVVLQPDLATGASLVPTAPAFGPDGKLLGLQEVLQRDAASTALLADSFINNTNIAPSQVVPGLLPFANEEQQLASSE
jgi:hypothetical protein